MVGRKASGGFESDLTEGQGGQKIWAGHHRLSVVPSPFLLFVGTLFRCLRRFFVHNMHE